MLAGVSLYARVCLRGTVFQQLLRHEAKIGRGHESALDVAQLARRLERSLLLLCGTFLLFARMGFLSGCLAR